MARLRSQGEKAEMPGKARIVLLSPWFTIYNLVLCLSWLNFAVLCII
jgi:hypothetical protein